MQEIAIDQASAILAQPREPIGDFLIIRLMAGAGAIKPLAIMPISLAFLLIHISIKS